LVIDLNILFVNEYLSLGSHVDSCSINPNVLSKDLSGQDLRLEFIIVEISEMLGGFGHWRKERIIFFIVFLILLAYAKNSAMMSHLENGISFQ